MALRVQLWGRLQRRRLFKHIVPLALGSWQVPLPPTPHPPMSTPLSPHTLTLTLTLTVRHNHSKPFQETCWSCHRDITIRRGEEGEDSAGVRFFCPCEKKVVLPPAVGCNYFDIMSCPISFQIDIEKLKKTHKELQRDLHPDKYATKSKEEQDYSAQQSAAVNRAYSTLLKPYSRGLYLLKLNGLTIDETDNLQHDPDFLERMWLLREAIEDATSTGDTATLQQIKTSNDANMESITAEVRTSFESGDYSAAKEGLSQMKYYVNVEELLTDTLELPP